MTLLLDTHIWLWRLLEPERVPHRVETVLSQPETEIALSPISVWETLVLARKGRLALEPNPRTWVRKALQTSRPTMVPLTHDIAVESEALEGYRASDLADRFLVATAIVEGLPLATADRAMLDFKGVETIA